MKVLTAKTKSFPRTVATKYGEKSVIDIWLEGETQSIWRPANDPAIMGLRSNQDIQVAKDSKGKISLVDTTPTLPTAENNSPKPQGINPDTKRAIATYVEEQAKLFGFCLSQASTIQGIQAEDIRPVATTLYLATQKRFGLN